MDEESQKWVRIIGVVLLVFANACFTFLGGTNNQMLTEACERFLMDSDEFHVPPLNCVKELFYLEKRIQKRLNDCNAYDHPNVDISENDGTH